MPGMGKSVVTHEGATTLIRGSHTVTLFRVPAAATRTRTLTGTWSGQVVPQLLATLD